MSVTDADRRLDPVPTAMWGLVAARAEATPDLLCAVDESGTSLTFAAYRDAAERVAAGFADLGVGRGTLVSWQLPTTLDALVLVAALSRLSATQNPILPAYRERELRFILGQCRPRLLVTTSTWRGVDMGSLGERVRDDVRDQVPDLELVSGTLPVGDPAGLPPWTPPPDREPAWIFYTSGTTGDPKGALHSDASLSAGPIAMADAYAVTSDDRYGMVFPFTHIGGIQMLVLQMVTACAAIVVDQFDLERTPAVLAEHGITMLSGGTPLAVLLLDAQRRRGGDRLFPGVRAVFAGASPKPPTLHADIRAEMGGLGALSCYGLTEAPMVVLSRVSDSDERLATTEGSPAGGSSLRIVADDGSPCPPGVQGEVRVRGPQVFLGYVDPAEEASTVDAEGWVRTGDLGSLDADGYLRITGRLKDIINRKGEKVSAKEVEDVLATHPALAEVAVIGVPDPLAGERLCACVALRDPGGEVSLEDLTAHCAAAGLSRQKFPERLAVLGALPRNATGKVVKAELRARFGAAPVTR